MTRPRPVHLTPFKALDWYSYRKLGFFPPLLLLVALLHDRSQLKNFDYYPRKEEEEGEEEYFFFLFPWFERWMNHLRSVSPATTVPTTRNECLSVVCLAIACQSAVIHRKRGEKDGGVCCPFQKLRDTRFFSSWIKNKRPPSSLLFFSAPTRFRKCSAARPPARPSECFFSLLFSFLHDLRLVKT